MQSLVESTEIMVAAAAHIDAAGKDAGTVTALLMAARKIDAWDVIVEWAIEDAAETRGARPAVPANDNVTLATYLKYAEALGLTPVNPKKPTPTAPAAAVNPLTSFLGQRSAK